MNKCIKDLESFLNAGCGAAEIPNYEAPYIILPTYVKDPDFKIWVL